MKAEKAIISLGNAELFFQPFVLLLKFADASAILCAEQVERAIGAVGQSVAALRSRRSTPRAGRLGATRRTPTSRLHQKQ